MAFDAKSHFKAFAFQAVHLSNLAVAGFAGDFLFDVSFVVEDHVLGQFEDFHPRRGRVAVEIVVFFLDLRMVGDDVIVAVQALFHWRESRVEGSPHIRVAVLAFDGLVPGMQPVAEGNGLLCADPGGRGGIEKEEKPSTSATQIVTQAMGPRFCQIRSRVSAKAVKNRMGRPRVPTRMTITTRVSREREVIRISIIKTQVFQLYSLLDGGRYGSRPSTSAYVPSAVKLLFSSSSGNCLK